MDLKELFTNNFFTRAQVDILLRMANLIIADGVGGGVSDNSKADKVTQLIAGTGLSGGGDLSANRTFALDLVFLDNRYPALVDGKIPFSYIPAQAIHDTFVVASEAAMTGLGAATVGDYAVRTDEGKTYVLSALPPSTTANWVELPAAAGLSSFNGRTGAVVPAQDDYTFDQLADKPTTRAGYGITDAEATIDNTGKTANDYWSGAKTFLPLNKAAVGLGNVDNTSDNNKPLGTTQLATLAAASGLGLIGANGPGASAATRDMATQFYERGISLKSFATGDGVTDDTTAITNWLDALRDHKRKGYVPAGNYVVATAVTCVGDEFDIECHPEAHFIGLSNESLGSELAPAANSGTWTVGTNITQDASGLHFNGANNLGAASANITLEDNVTYEVTYTISGYVGGAVRALAYGPDNVGTGPSHSANGTYTDRVTTSGSTTAFVNQLRFQATGSSGTNDFDITSVSLKKVLQSANTPMLTLTSSTGSQSVRAGSVRWASGRFDCDQRNYTLETNGIGLLVENYATVSVEGVQFVGAVDHEVAEATGKAGCGLYVRCCDRVRVRNNVFTGFVEAGLLITGGALSATSDDGIGSLVQGNHFVRCKYGWKAMRTARSVSVSGNAYDQCYIGGAALENGSARAARVSVTGEHMRRPGKFGLQLREQLGFVVANNTILDVGYKVDGTTQIPSPSYILLEGCTGGEVANNVLRNDELAKFNGSVGIEVVEYVDGANTFQSTDISVSNNHIGGVQFGCSEAGANGVNNSYRNNDFSNVTTFYSSIPGEFLPYGTYTPVASGLTNIASAVPSESRWRRVDRDIIVSLFVALDPTATGAGSFTITLPVDPGADFDDAQDVLGNISSGTAGPSAHGHITANLAARTALVSVNFGTDVGNHGWAGQFAYRLADVSSAPPPPPVSGEVLRDHAGQDILIIAGGDQITVDLA